MDDIKEFLKKYWPYVVGGIVGLYLLLRFSGGSSSGGSVGALPVSGYNAQDAMLQSNERIANAQVALEGKKIDANIALTEKQFDIQKSALHAQAFNDFNKSQAAMAYALGDSSGKMIDALNTPALSAMLAGATENAAAYTAIGNMIGNSFLAQGGMVAASSAATGQLGSAFFSNNTRLNEGAYSNNTQIPERATGIMDVMKTAAWANSPAGYSGNQQSSGGNGFGNFMSMLNSMGSGSGNGGVSSNPSGNYLSAQNTTSQGAGGMFDSQFISNGLGAASMFTGMGGMMGFV